MAAAQDGINHAAGTAARGRRRLRALGALLAVLAPGALHAQTGTPGLSDLPARGEVDQRSDPFPFDPRLEIRSYFRTSLPSLWWASEPTLSLGVFAVTIHIPDDWRGNPSAAMARLCPPDYSTLWQHVDRIELVPYYRDARRTGSTCRASMARQLNKALGAGP